MASDADSEAEEQAELMGQLEQSQSTSSGWVSVDDSGANTPREVPDVQMEHLQEIDFVTLGMFIIGMLLSCLSGWALCHVSLLCCSCLTFCYLLPMTSLPQCGHYKLSPPGTYCTYCTYCTHVHHFHHPPVLCR